MRKIIISIALISAGLNCMSQDTTVYNEIKKFGVKCSFITLSFQKYHDHHGSFPASIEDYSDSIKADKNTYEGFKNLITDPFSNDKPLRYILLKSDTTKAIIGFAFLSNWIDREIDIDVSELGYAEFLSLLDKNIMVPEDFEITYNKEKEAYWVIDKEMVYPPLKRGTDILVGLYIKSPDESPIKGHACAPYETNRVGAKCRDGSISEIKGENTCSSHGGVAYWICE